MLDKFKSAARSQKAVFAVLVVLVGVAAYGLGLQAGALSETVGLSGASQPAIVFTAAPDTLAPADAIPVVTSRGGTKYHRLDCPGARTIKDSNKIYFDSIELARSAGYLPAGNCEGLQ